MKAAYLVRQKIHFVKSMAVLGKNKKCISDKTIAAIHGMRIPDVRRRITDNISRFNDGTDCIDLKSCAYDAQQLLVQLGYTKMEVSKAEHIYLLSERGYAKLIKIMDSDLFQIKEKCMENIVVGVIISATTN